MRITIAENTRRKDGIPTAIVLWILQRPYKLPGLKTVGCKLSDFHKI